MQTPPGDGDDMLPSSGFCGCSLIGTFVLAAVDVLPGVVVMLLSIAGHASFILWLCSLAGLTLLPWRSCFIEMWLCFLQMMVLLPPQLNNLGIDVKEPNFVMIKV
jgi:hypothetical protein